MDMNWGVPSCQKFLAMVDGIFDSVLCIMNAFFGITKPHFCFASDLVVDALGLLFLVSDKLAGLLLNFSSEVLDSAFDLIFVHDGFPSKVNDLFGKRASR
jgi:hypothetical protein